MCSSDEKGSYKVSLQSITDNVYDILKCVECGEYCHPPFNQNKEGELVCPSCLLCDEFGIPVLTGTIFILESMYSLFEFPCQYNIQGCKFKAKGNKLVEHHKVCDYVSILCHINDCCWQGRPREEFYHFSTHHSDFTRIYNSNHKEIHYMMSSGSTACEVYIIFYFGKVFTVQLFRNNRIGIFCYAATNMEPFDISNYECIIEFDLENGRTTRTILNLIQSHNTMREKMHEFPLYHLPFDSATRSKSIILMKKP